MLKNRFLKLVTALTCIVTLVLPHTNVVLAAALTNDEDAKENEVKLVSSDFHEGGKESSESIGETEEDYDENSYKYTFGGQTDILKIVREDDKIEDEIDKTITKYAFSDAFYCLDGNDSFPKSKGAITYKRTIKNMFAENPKTLNLTDDNYNSLCWLLNNMYLRKQMTAADRANYKNTLFKNAFSEELNSDSENALTLDDIKAILTDDDIEVIQQWAIWYFTNYGEKTLQDVPFTNKNNTLPTVDLTNARKNR